MTLARIVAAGMAVGLVATTSLAQTWVRDPPFVLRRIVATRDGGSISAGSYGSMSWAGAAMKLDVEGNLEWMVVLDGPGYDVFNDVAELTDGFACVGETRTDATTMWPWIVKLDAAGTLAWQRTLGPSQGIGQRVVGTPDGGLATWSEVQGARTDPDVALTKLDASGSPAWTRTYSRHMASGCGSMVNWHDALLREPDGGFLVATGITESCTLAGTNYDTVLLRFAPDGTLLFEHAFGAPFPLDDIVTSLAPAPAGGYVAVASEWPHTLSALDRSGLLFRLDPSGAVRWTRIFGDPEKAEYLEDVVALADGSVVVLGRAMATGLDHGTVVIVSDAGELLERHDVDDRDLFSACPHPLGGLLVGGERLAARMDDRCAARSTCLDDLPVTGFFRDRPTVEWEPGRSVTPASFTVVDATPAWSSLTPLFRCQPLPCVALACGSVTADPPSPCSGRDTVLGVDVTGGEAPIVVDWDLDGDGAPDASGNPLTTRLPAGRRRVTATVSDACFSGVQSCGAFADLDVLDLAVPGEVSDTLSGAGPLTVSRPGDVLEVEAVSDATTYNVYAGAIGTWSAPTAVGGTTCDVPATPAGAGRLRLDLPLLPDTWILVTGANACGEGPAGRTSLGAARDAAPTWTPCR